MIITDHSTHSFDKTVSKSQVVSHLKANHSHLLRDIAPTAFSPKYLRDAHNNEHEYTDRNADLDKTPRKRSSVMSGGAITCANCQILKQSDPAGDLFIEWPRSLDNFDYECAKCGAHIHPYTETGASR